MHYSVSSLVRNHLEEEERAGPEVIKHKFILKLKIKRNDWLLADTCPQVANHCTLLLYYFEFETVPKFYTSGPGCFAFIILRMSCYCNCSVTLPHGAVGWSAVCDCGIS